MQLFKKLFRKRHNQTIYSSFEAAAKECVGIGYDCEDLARSVVAKTEIRRGQMDAPSGLKLDLAASFSLASITLAAIGQHKLKVIDFGGAAGLHYFVARKLLPADLELQWVVVETPVMAEQARSKLADRELNFVSSLEEAAAIIPEADVLHNSGALQQVADPCVLLGQLLAVQARYLLLTRIGLIRGSSHLITTHQSRLSDHGPGTGVYHCEDRPVKTPYVFSSEDKFIRCLSQAYHTIAKIDDPSGVFRVPAQPIFGIGLLCRRGQK